MIHKFHCTHALYTGLQYTAPLQCSDSVIYSDIACVISLAYVLLVLIEMKTIS